MSTNGGTSVARHDAVSCEAHKDMNQLSRRMPPGSERRPVVIPVVRRWPMADGRWPMLSPEA
eukprot:1222279-Prymnesium_polylepis.1